MGNEITNEESYIFYKNYTCPLCDEKIVAPTVRTGKTRIDHTDPDLRNVHKGIDINKYDVVMCNHCGYAAFTRYVAPLAKPHKDLLNQGIRARFKATEEVRHPLSYEEALYRCKMAQLNAVTRQAKTSEKAFICLKTAWIYRGLREELVANGGDARAIDEAMLAERKYLSGAMSGFADARVTEMPPIAGMDEVTYDYLLARLCYDCEDYDMGLRVIQDVISSKVASSTQKDKARDLIQLLKDAKK